MSPARRAQILSRKLLSELAEVRPPDGASPDQIRKVIAVVGAAAAVERAIAEVCEMFPDGNPPADENKC